MKIFFTGGGTGGHVFPIIAVVREIKRAMPKGTNLFYLGPGDEWVSLYLSQEDIKIKTIFAGKIRRFLTLKAILLNIVDAIKLIIGFFQAFFIIFSEKPDLIFSKGGYGSIPAILCAKLLRIPVFMHESDVYPGLANQINARFALEIFISFPKTEYLDPQKMILVGNPIRREVFGGSKRKSEKMFNLTGEKKIILVLGGSQGAQRINDFLLLSLEKLLKEFEIIHQCGRKNFKDIKRESRVVVPKKLEKYYHLYPFLEEQKIREAYFIADLIICRAGANSIFEIAALGKPSILIPLPESAQNHQVKNAYAFAEKGATLVIEETNLTPQFFLETLKSLMSRPEELKKMSEAAKKFSKPRAAKVIAHYLLEYLMM